MSAGAAADADVTVLRDGRVVRVRPVGPGDVACILGFLRGLSADTVYSRFFSLRPDLAREALACMGDAEHPCRGLLALPVGETFAVGHAGYWPLSRGRAELAIAVADDHQGLGLGGLLLRRLAEIARGAGVEVFQMDVLSFNLGALRLLAGSGYPLRASLGEPPYSGVVRCKLRVGAEGRRPSPAAA